MTALSPAGRASSRRVLVVRAGRGTGQLAATDLVVHCWSMGTITADQLRGITTAVAAGTGLLGWHGGILDSFPGERGWHLMTGGQLVHHHAGDLVRYRVDIAPSGATHPVVAGLGPFDVVSEQYYVHCDPGNEVLATTTYVEDPDVPGLGGGAMPVAWTRTWGRGRVFVTTIGHRPADLSVPQVEAMVLRASAWAAR